MPAPLSTRYVVLHWPQPGTDKPELANDSLFAKLIDADDLAREMTAEAKRDGRPNTFTVHEISMNVETY